jgi:saccharopine dehydrogenase-like NADP-dependent oxidoreductase
MQFSEAKILIVGSNGILGKHLVEKVINTFGVASLVLSDKKEARLAKKQEEIRLHYDLVPSIRVIDIYSQESIRKGLEGVDIVLIPVQQQEPLIQVECIAKGIHSIDLSVDPAFLASALKLKVADSEMPLQLVAGGLFPGLSGIMAADLYQSSRTGEVIDVALLQSANGTNGKSGVSDMLQLFNQDVALLTEDSQTHFAGFSHKKLFTFPDPLQARQLRLTNFIERAYLQRGGILANYWTAFDKETLNQLISGLKKLGFLNLFEGPRVGKLLSTWITRETSEDTPEHIGLCVKNSTESRFLVLKSDYEATAACAVAFLDLALKKKSSLKGVKFPFEVFSYRSVLPYLAEVMLYPKPLH